MTEPRRVGHRRRRVGAGLMVGLMAALCLARGAMPARAQSAHINCGAFTDAAWTAPADCVCQDETNTPVSCNERALFACFGSLGVGCGLHTGFLGGLWDIPCRVPPQPAHPFELECPVGAGSIVHDLCCAEHPDLMGNGCGGGVINDPWQACFQEWTEAEYDVQYARYWWRTFDTRRRVTRPFAAQQQYNATTRRYGAQLVPVLAPMDQVLGPYRLTGWRSWSEWVRCAVPGW